MNAQQKAEQIYASITCYANYSEMNGIEREWFLKCIEKGLTEFSISHSPVKGDLIGIIEHVHDYKSKEMENPLYERGYNDACSEIKQKIDNL